MVRVLERVAEGVSTRTALQTEMADARREYTRAASLIVRSILNDTVVDVADLRTWLGNMESIEADRCVVSSYVDEGDFTSAFSLAGTFPTVYGLTGNALVEHGYYMDMLDLYRTLYNSGRNTEQLDSGERADVSLIAAQSQGVAGAMARVVLANYLDADVVLSGFTCPGLTPPVGGRGGEYTPWSVEETARGAGIALEVAPNPAANWTAVRCTLPAGATEAIVEVSDLLGTRMAAYRISPDDGGRKILDLRGLPSGVYLVTLRCQGQRHTEKLVIAR